jgi:hypothetical protein
MAAEIFHAIVTDDDPHQIGAEMIDDPGLFCVSGFTDINGNPTFVHAQDGVVRIFTARVIEQSESGQLFEKVRDEAKLQKGDVHKQTLYDADGSVLQVHVRNVGATSIRPMLN